MWCPLDFSGDGIVLLAETSSAAMFFDRYRDLRGPIAGEAVVTLATPEYPFGFPVASLTKTRYL